MKCCLINLDRSTDRLDWFMRSTASMGLEIERISAIDGRHIPPEEVQHYRSLRNRGYPLGHADIGCFLSHRLAWQAIVDAGHPWAFVAEDDVHFAAGSEPFFSDQNWIPEDADIVKAETFLEITRLSRWKNIRAFGLKLARLRTTHLGAAGYFLSARCAANLLEQTVGMCDVPDVILFDEALGVFPQLTVYQIDPALCVQDYKIEGRTGFKMMGSVRVDTNTEKGMDPWAKEIPPKLRGKAKVWREFSRPFTRLVRFFKMIATGQRVKLVRFRERE